MNGTPRPRSGAFPQTPDAAPRSNRSTRFDTPQGGPRTPNVLPDLPTAAPAGRPSNPLIPADVIDEPSQRLYVVAFYLALLAWRSMDWWSLQTSDTESFAYLFKWILIDGAFMFGLPALKIPWLEWSLTTMTMLFAGHCVLDFMAMLRIPIPILTWIAGAFKLVYDREMAIQEYSVDAWRVLNNESLILGRQIVNILPEGSAVLNPDNGPFCLEGSKDTIQLPIQINQTKPILIELLRVDLDTNQNETIKIKGSAANKLVKAAKKKGHFHSDDPLLLEYPVKKTGLYSLSKVVDDSNLEVQTHGANVLVVTCPRAHIKPSGPAKCKGENAQIGIVAEGTPPLNIQYRRMVNGERRISKHQGLQPSKFISPLDPHQHSDTLVRGGELDLSYARVHSVDLPLHDPLAQSGVWIYTVDEISDGLGNVVTYRSIMDENDNPKLDEKLQRAFFVNERPSAFLHGCDSQHPIQIAKGQTAVLPIRYSSTKQQPLHDSMHVIDYYFTPEGELGPQGEHGENVQVKQQVVKNTGQKLLIKESGLYTLKGVSTDVCAGDVQEPASCLLLNPPEPELAISSQEIFDKCANNPIGLRVDLDLIGTPPFTVTYTQRKKGGGERQIHETVSGLRGQLEIFPPKEGHYTYTFTEISDQVYKAQSMKHKGLVLEQDVKPSASASFIQTPPAEACIDEPLRFAVKMQGEGPWKLEYELVHAGKREKKGPFDVETEHTWLSTDKLSNGGEYTLALASVTDRLGCKEFLKEEVKISVRHERPKAYFGQVEGKRSLRTLEGKQVSLPVKLTGKAPWTVRYQNINSPDAGVLTAEAHHANDYLRIVDKGLYELLQVNDAICPGTVDDLAKQFEVSLIPRPQIGVRDTSKITREGDRFFQQDVCEGENDNVDLLFSGSPPYHVGYEERHFPTSGAKSLRQKAFNSATNLGSIILDTSRPGLCEYEIKELSDNNYDHDRKIFRPLTIEQRVHPRPSAQWASPGKTYSYCTTEAEGEEVIPVTFTGLPPFYLEVDLKHHGASKPETLSFPEIPSNKHSIKIPHRHLHLGSSSLTIRKVSDARGCRNKAADLAPNTAPRVLIAVHNAPSIAPLDQRGDFCVGDRLSYTMSGVFPFEVFYTFNGVERKAAAQGTTFRRMAEKPGLFTITGVTDSASKCRAATELIATIHEMPSVRVSKGKTSRVDIHEGGEAEILFDFYGTPPFEFTYTRSTNEDRLRGIRSQVLETRTLVSEEFSLRIKASEEGTYEVVSIRDHWCAFSKGDGGKTGRPGQKVLAY